MQKVLDTRIITEDCESRDEQYEALADAVVNCFLEDCIFRMFGKVYLKAPEHLSVTKLTEKIQATFNERQVLSQVMSRVFIHGDPLSAPIIEPLNLPPAQIIGRCIRRRHTITDIGVDYSPRTPREDYSVSIIRYCDHWRRHRGGKKGKIQQLRK